MGCAGLMSATNSSGTMTEGKHSTKLLWQNVYFIPSALMRRQLRFKELSIIRILANTAEFVGKVGSAVTHAAELLTAISPERSTARKVISLEDAAELAERWRHRGWRVGFTNGCFDLLHPGHVHLLEAGRAKCDRLIVGLNTDASARRLKGPSRPVQPQEARAAVLASLASVDLVCVFDEDTPERLIRAVRPDVLITGGDDTVEDVFGVDLLREWGGQVTVADVLPGHSTQATLERIRG